MSAESKSQPINVLAGAMGILAIRITGAAISYGMFLVIARLTNPTEFGLFGFSLSLAAVLSLVISGGQATAILRLWPQFQQGESDAQARKTLILGLSTVVALGLFSMAIFTGANAFLPENFYPHYRDLVVPLSLLGCLLAISQYLSSSLRARGKTWFGLIPRELVWRSVVVISAWTGAHYFDVRLNAVSLVWLMAAVLAAVFFPQLVSTLRLMLPWIGAMRARLDLRAWRRLSIGLWQVTTLEVISLETGVVLLGLIAAPEAVAIYFLADRLAGLLGFPVLAANVYVAPVLSRLHYSEQQDELQDVCKTASLIAFLPALLGFIAVVVLGATALRFIGSAYESAWPVLLILAFGQLANSAFGATGSLMQMTGHELVYRKLLWLNIALSIPAAVLLFVLWGGIGIAIGVVVPRIARNFSASLHLRRELQLDPTMFSFLRSGAT